MFVGKCKICKTDLMPVYFEEAETVEVEGKRLPTGRTRQSCKKIICPGCGETLNAPTYLEGAWKAK